MSDENFYEGQSPQARLRVWGLGQMVYGALLAAGALVAIGAVLGAIWIVGALLPEESKTAPSPNSSLEVVQTVHVA